MERVQTVLATHSSSIVHMGDAGAGQFAKLCNNALTISNLRNIVEVFSLADRLGVSLSGLREAFAHSSGGSFMLDAIGTKVTPHVAAHIASLNRRDMEEFASAMKRQGLDATTILNWGLGGADGLVSVVDRWSAPRFTGQVG
ncbi:UNVERIFIED_ORG: 3-hydroxyisobutyrate dehydrogenase-like beta-hydroxyacid dehydrogenase [Rhizobium aethiopicum]